ncbi:hypothetical protein V5O48_000868 [Marasmius crinis-equi]|uniref:RlpA-like protein double-psi beta-barrel domain-containing protein n=1 Tax=Marasmius crinis-equi TaxID=585013 RepID=A0ABR3G0I9_9AGAR
MSSFITTLIFALLASQISVLAAPVSPAADTLEKRLTRSGRGTWFKPGMGNCGQRNTDNDPIVAIGGHLYNQNNGGNCDQWVQITANGKTAYGLTRDSCPECSDDDLDMSPSLFKKFAGLDVGVLDIKWSFKPKGWSP